MSNVESDPVPGRLPFDHEKPANWNWLWFFAILLTLTLGGVLLETWFNHRQQLTASKLAQAQSLWQQAGLQDYHFEYALTNRDRQVSYYQLRVRAGQPEPNQELDLEQYPYKTMEELFTKIGTQLLEDQQPGQPKVFATASFDPKTGQVFRYVRSIRATRERVEVIVQRCKNAS